jgi:protein TonB
VDQPATGAQPSSDNRGASSGPESAETQATGSHAGDSTTSLSTTVAVPTFIPPRPLSEILPKYPLGARRSGFEGVVKVSVLVDERGTVTGIDVLSSSGHASLDQAVLDAYRHARFAPALQDGKPVAGRLVIPVRFRLAAGQN